jgi:hypothetical protein
VLGVGGIYGLAVKSRNDQIEALQEENASIKKQIEGYGDLDKRLEAMNAQYAGELVMLDELYDLIARFPDRPGIRITKVTWAPAAAGTAATPGAPAPAASPKPGAKKESKPVGQIKLEATGNAAGLEALKQALLKETHWTLDDWEADPSDQPTQVKASFKVFHREPGDYTTVLGPTVNSTPVPASAAPQGGPGRGAGQGNRGRGGRAPDGTPGGGPGRGRRGGGGGRPQGDRPTGGQQL